MGKYSQALGISSDHRVQTTLSLTGVGQWAVSKTPAVLGGYIADWAYTKAVEKFFKPGSKWVAETIGTVGAVIAAFGLQLAGSRFLPDSTHMLDKVTDGMCGRMSKPIVNTAKRLLGMTPANAANANLSLDGDDEATRQVAALISGSPEFLDVLADGMVDAMRRDEVDIDSGAKPALVKSMREVARQLANQ